MKWVFIGVGGLLGIGILLYGIGLLLPQAHVASSSVLIRQPIDSVWRVVRTFDEYDAWWPEVSSVERLPDRNGQEVWTLRQPTGELPMQVIESTAAERLVTRIADDNLPFGGTWTYELREQDGGTLVTVTEDGEIYNPFFRVMSKLIFGYHRTQESYLSALAQKFGEEVVIERLR